MIIYDETVPWAEDKLLRVGRYHQWLLNTQRFASFPFASHVWAQWHFDFLARQVWEDEGGR
jgi:hypothetical protein